MLAESCCSKGVISPALPAINLAWQSTNCLELQECLRNSSTTLFMIEQVWLKVDRLEKDNMEHIVSMALIGSSRKGREPSSRGAV